ncbi:hypothetical protein, partial [Sneathiella sp.]|uniref:phosphatase PAP2 family protein n=1 Tax=Sneathiella sp. TaxID=1964365 RepID=UPI00356A5E7C
MTGSPLRLRQSIIVLAVCYSVALLLGISDLTGLYDVIWSDLDTLIFRSLNDMATPDAAISQFWAMTNSKTFDHGVFVMMLGIVIYLVMSTKREDRIEATAKVGAIIFLILIALLISKKIIGDDFYHPSPAYLLEPYNNVNDFISGYTVKTATDNSFPGDHAMTSALFAGGIILLFRRPYVATLSVLLMIFVSLPR